MPERRPGTGCARRSVGASGARRRQNAPWAGVTLRERCALVLILATNKQ
jgi:hypothetical protein